MNLIAMIDFLGLPTLFFTHSATDLQHHGSPHVHSLPWLPNAPDIETINTSAETKPQLIEFIDSIIGTINPAIDIDGYNQNSAPMPQTNPHICNISYNVENYEQDLVHLIATCQPHTRCSPAYCLRTKNGQQVCHFGYLKPLQRETVINEEYNDIEVLTKRNDILINNFNHVQ